MIAERRCIAHGRITGLRIGPARLAVLVQPSLANGGEVRIAAFGLLVLEFLQLALLERAPSRSAARLVQPFDLSF